jgi:hypothetical protein
LRTGHQLGMEHACRPSFRVHGEECGQGVEMGEKTALRAASDRKKESDRLHNSILVVDYCHGGKSRKQTSSVAMNHTGTHMLGIACGKKGDIKHLNLREVEFNHADFVGALRDYEVRELVIREGPNSQGGCVAPTGKLPPPFLALWNSPIYVFSDIIFWPET